MIPHDIAARSPELPMMRIIPSLLITLLVGVIAACERQQAPVSVSAQTMAPDAEALFGRIEHEYVVYFMGRFPVVATYLGGSAFDPALADIDGKLRDNSAAAPTAEDSRLAEFRRQFDTLDPGSLTARRRIDRSVAVAQIDFLLHQHQVLRHQLRAIDSYVDEPFRGIDWQIQGMTPAVGGKLGTLQEWREVIARTRAIPQYMAVAQQQIEAGMRDTKPITLSLEVGCRVAPCRRCTGLSADPDVRLRCCLHPERWSRNPTVAKQPQEH